MVGTRHAGLHSACARQPNPGQQAQLTQGIRVCQLRLPADEAWQSRQPELAQNSVASTARLAARTWAARCPIVHLWLRVVRVQVWVTAGLPGGEWSEEAPDSSE